MIYENKFSWNDNKSKMKIELKCSDDINIVEKDKTARIEYLEGIFNNSEQVMINMRKIVRVIKTLFDKYDLTYFYIVFDNLEGHEVVVYENDQLINYSIARRYDSKDVINIDINNTSLNVRINQDYYNTPFTPKQVRAEVNELLYYYDYLNDIKQKPLTLRLMKFIGAYELFYNEEPKFYLDSCKIKMYKMLHILRDCGLLTDVMDVDYNISDALDDILYTYIDFNIYDKVFDDDTKNKIVSLGNDIRRNNSHIQDDPIKLSRKI